MNTPIQNRYEFVYLFDVVNGNPNGDPDAGNLPRLDPETSRGLVTDVCLKRKIRNYIALKHLYEQPFDIYVKEKSILGRAHSKAYSDAGINLGEETRRSISEDQNEELQNIAMPEGISVDIEEDGSNSLVLSIDIDKKEVQKWIKDIHLSKDFKKLIKDAISGSKTRKPKQEEIEKGKEVMLNRFVDIRMFGAVMSLKSAPNCGQVRGPVQLSFARSEETIVPMDISITRMAVATEREAEAQGGDNRTMGRKSIVPYGLYRCHGFISAPLAAQTGFGEDDLDLLWESLQNMFEHDHSAARGEMAARKLVVFKHDNKLGNAPAHKLFDLVQVKRADGSSGPARSYADYAVTVAPAPTGVEIIEIL
jgi:CRISPR-associated protein Csd2